MNSATQHVTTEESPVDAGGLPQSADEAWQRLNEGSRRFAEWVEAQSGSDDFETRTGLADPGNISKQTPFGVVIGCSDARVPLRTALGQRTNSLFEIRVAGNVLADGCLGSVDFALSQLPSVKSIVVLGHTHCGALTAAVNACLKPSTLNAVGVSAGLRAIVQRLFGPVVHAGLAWQQVAKAVGDVRPSPSNEELIETAIYLHAATAAVDLRSQVALSGRTDVSVLYGVFDMQDYHIRSIQTDNDGGRSLGVGLSPAPENGAALEQVAYATAASVARCEFMS